ncbi:MAG: response regulator [Bryobacterales bacterium]|nr:response regulator [Bryobacteraceae bacterium]MDW8130191.1 response regulator [Bryobacterales bacterium]
MSEPKSLPRRILVVDDDDEARLALRRMLEEAGFDVLEAPNGRVALGICRSHPLDVVITDICMPEQEGLETIQALRREFPRVKLIAISGQPAAAVYLRMAKLLGAQATLEKPIRLETLLDTVGSVLAAEPGE